MIFNVPLQHKPLYDSVINFQLMVQMERKTQITTRFMSVVQIQWVGGWWEILQARLISLKLQATNWACQGTWKVTNFKKMKLTKENRQCACLKIMLASSILQTGCFAVIADAVEEPTCACFYTHQLWCSLSAETKWTRQDYLGVWGALMEADAMREITGIKQDLCWHSSLFLLHRNVPNPKVLQGYWTVFQTKKQEAVGLKNCTSDIRSQAIRSKGVLTSSCWVVSDVWKTQDNSQ